YVMIYINVYDTKATVVRLSNIYGPRASIHSPEFTFNNYFIGLALQDKDITVYGDGKQLRNILFVEDAIDALVMSASSKKADGNIFFAVGDEHYSVCDIAKLTAKHIGGGKVKFIDWPQGKKKADVGDALISNKKIKKILGWSPQYTLPEGLKETKEYYLRHMDKYIKDR
ncbi:MAG: GDP-mannose 4,6-dehydratase, partial [Candidatus Omnitrophica bacterium]|nr:GDP-mannose 4,6-dehydratase [Candidatus Omnitrophota bacterium]